jgi:glycine/D-amino acid oxidase-like deaminating enzyme
VAPTGRQVSSDERRVTSLEPPVTHHLPTADIIICGAGIAGISAAYHLAQRGITDVLLVDERAPLTMTSDKSTEAYRNWWPGPGDAMVALHEPQHRSAGAAGGASDNYFHLNRRGYVFLTADPRTKAALQTEAEEDFVAAGCRSRCACIDGRSRTIRSIHPSPPRAMTRSSGGLICVLDPAIIRRHFPYINARCVCAHAAIRAAAAG